MTLLKRFLPIYGLLLLFGVFSLPRYLRAQNSTGEIDGIVRDSTGALIPKATVTVNNADQNLVVRALKTDGQGQFVASALATGTYWVAVEAAGFQTETIRPIEVNVNQHTAIQVVLPSGSVSQRVVVTIASSVAPDTQSSAAGTLLTGPQVAGLPLEQRNFEQLLSLQPGITGDVPGSNERGIVSGSGATSTTDASVNGQRVSQNGFYLDGADLLNHGGSTQVNIFPSIDAIEEMNLLRNGYGAQYGGSGSAIISMQTRSGTTSFHGGAFEFFRSQILNANNYFNNLGGVSRPGLRYSDYGYRLGGPVWIPKMTDRQNAKTFFFFLQEFLREEEPFPVTLTDIPTALQQQGLFTSPVCVAYNGSKCAKSATSITQFDPTAQAYLKDIISKTPLPNSPIDPQGLITSEQGFKNETQTVIRIDHQFSQKLSVFFRYLDDPYHVVSPYGFGNSSAIPEVSNANVANGGTSYLGHATFAMSPNTVFEGGYAYDNGYIFSQPTGLGLRANSPDINPTLPYPTVLPQVPSVIVLAAAGTYGAAGYNNIAHYNQIFLNVTHTAGRHTFYFGGSYESQVSGNDSEGTNAGQYTFSATVVPTGSAATQYMQAFANFLEGAVSTFTQQSVAGAVLSHAKLFEAYFQDDFRLTPRLTLNGGVRYSFIGAQYAGPYLGQNIPLTNFVPNLYNPANAPTVGSTGLICTTAPCPGGGTPNPAYSKSNGVITQGGNSPFGPAVTSQPNLNFAPRLGLAWDVFGNGETALRGGYGIYYEEAHLGISVNQAQTNQPYVSTTSISNTSFGNPGNGVPLGNSSVFSAQAIASHWSTPYSQDWNLDVQQQLAHNMVLDVGYYGNRGAHLIGQLDINQAPIGSYVAKTTIAPGGITASNSVDLNSLRPYLGYGALKSIEPIFDSNYNSLQTSLNKRFEEGSNLSLSYTWSRALTDGVADSGSAPQNSADLRSEYGLTSFNRSNVLTLNAIYHLPFFREQHGVVGYALGGWETTGIITYASGFPMSPKAKAADPGGLGLLSAGSIALNRPDQVGDPNSPAPHSLMQWFNTAAFVSVPTADVRPGDAGAENIIGPGYEVWTLGLFKNFPLRESLVLQFRAEAFNAFNHTNFTTINTAVGNSNYGQATAAGEARTMQLAAKISF